MSVLRTEVVYLDRDAWDALPIIITEPGDYCTRDGRRATVREIRDTATFSAKGAIWVEYRGKIRPRSAEIWHTNGRASFEAEGRRRDIVGPWVCATGCNSPK